MANSDCFLCPGRAAIYTGGYDSGTGYATAVNQAAWVKLPHTVSWGQAPDTEDPAEIRTSDTDNKKVKVCPGATKFDFNVTSALCNDDWLYYYILNSPHTDPTDGVLTWFFFSLDGNPPIWPAGPAHPNTILQGQRGIFALGEVQAPGIEFDNDSSDPVVVEWSIRVKNGPWLPKAELTGDTRPLLAAA